MKRTAQMIGYSMLLYLGSSLFMQFMIVFAAEIFGMVYAVINGGDMENALAITKNGWFMMIASIISSYVAAPLSAWLLARKLPDAVPDKTKLTIGKTLVSGCVCLGVLYLFGYLSEGILWVVSKIFNTTIEQLNAVNQMSMQFSNLQYILLICVAAPVVEELFFRGFIIKKMLVHGKTAALVISAAVFGLVHGTLSQIPYALALGFVLGYIYIRFGNIYLNIGLHAVMNFMGGVLYMLIEDVPYADYISLGISIAFIVAAIIILVLKWKDIKNYIFDDASDTPASQQAKTVLFNLGFILFAVLCFLLMLFTLASTVIVANLN